MSAPLFVEPCLPTISRTVPTGPQWAYEIKHDGFRFLAVRHRKQVRVYSRGGHDWSERLPSITKALLALPVRSIVLDGEGVICGPDGRSEFDCMCLFQPPRRAGSFPIRLRPTRA
jgi:bifunctional non-homologous end joining protein LigD